jgi:hypothetical protein
MNHTYHELEPWKLVAAAVVVLAISPAALAAEVPAAACEPKISYTN